MHRFAVIALLAVATPQPAHAFCAVPQMMAPLVLGARQIASDGGILVLTEGRAVEKFAPQRVKSDGVLAAPDIVAIAPGLVLYRLPPRTKQAEVVEGKSILATIKVGIATPRLAAPRIARIESKIEWGRKTMQQSMVTLAAEPPAGAVALVVTVFHHFGCGTVPEGMAMPMTGSKVKLRWIDASGRASPDTKAFTVTEMSR